MLGFLFFWDYRNWWIGVARQGGENSFMIVSFLMFAIVVSPSATFICVREEQENSNE